MAYNLRITKHAEKLLDRLVYYLLYRLKNEQAARHLLDSINDIYERLEENPLQFPRCRDNFLDQKGYHEVVVPQMNYVVVFSIDGNVVNVLGFFHQLENYLHKKKITELVNKKERYDYYKRFHNE